MYSISLHSTLAQNPLENCCINPAQIIMSQELKPCALLFTQKFLSKILAPCVWSSARATTHFFCLVVSHHRLIHIYSIGQICNNGCPFTMTTVKHMTLLSQQIISIFQQKI